MTTAVYLLIPAVACVSPTSKPATGAPLETIVLSSDEEEEVSSPDKRPRRAAAASAAAAKGQTQRPAAAAMLRHKEQSGKLLHALSMSARNA